MKFVIWNRFLEKYAFPNFVTLLTNRRYKNFERTLTAGCNLMILIRCRVCLRLILRTCSSPWWCLFADLANRLFIISFLRALNSWSIDFDRESLLCLPLPLTCLKNSDRLFSLVRLIEIKWFSFKIELWDTLQEKQPSVDIVLSSAGGMW